MYFFTIFDLVISTKKHREYKMGNSINWRIYFMIVVAT